MPYIRRTEDEYVVQGNYGHGWEDVTVEDTRAEAKARLKEYKENEPQHAHRMFKRRVKVTPVIFRVFIKLDYDNKPTREDDVIAVFPTLPGDSDPKTCLTYVHFGQHGSGNPNYIMCLTREPEDGEADALLDELKSIGYNDLKIIKLVPRTYKDESARDAEKLRAAGLDPGPYHRREGGQL